MATGILQSLGGGITPEEWERILAGQYPQGVMDFEGYDKMINQHYDSWSPTDGIPGEGNPLPVHEIHHNIGEPVSNLGLPDVASAYSPGTESNPNWGNKKYDYKKNIYDVQTIDLMINSGAINPKRDRLTHRPDVAEDAYQVHLASADNTLWNDQLQMFMSPDWMRTGSMGQERFKENIMGGDKRYRSLRSNAQRGTTYQPLKFT